MFFHFKVLLYSIVFIAGLELTVSRYAQDFINDFLGDRPITAALIIISLMAYVFQVARKIGKRSSMAAIPVFLTLASLGLLYFIDAKSQKHIFAFISGAVYYFILLGIYRLKGCATDQTARGIVAASAFATLFLCYSVTHGIYINFAVPLWSLMLVYFIATVLISVQFFYLLEVSQKTAWIHGLVLGLVMTQISWAITFWPFGYLTIGVIALMFYYVFWDLVSAHFLEITSKKRLISNVIIVSILIAVVLTSSRWLPVV